ncbi:hypothetical protein Sinac_2103 [Singulisphaera acidiphila DSM 18658]|uniref:Uncharacterized protein n=1 Tax=Singulisphaera acidiphila (strain ATCC BAA-1392 / DSM 18658 / VKM B-2454 / MOB10) TaxID=886293 RepID=L0DC83_SINAD|nr:hypothetical protein Sinac_2103 [Singulisphaera acidiphila DSM 18658]
MLRPFASHSARRLIPILLPMFVLYFCLSDGTAAESNPAQPWVLAVSRPTRTEDSPQNSLMFLSKREGTIAQSSVHLVE